MKQVLKLIEAGELDDKVSDWYSLLGFCDFHRITGYLADKLIAIPDAPAQLKRHTGIQKAYQTHKQNKIIDAAKEMSTCLEEAKLPHSFLKGVILSGEIYGAGQRCSNDVDLLISPNNVGKASDILKSLGYIQGVYKDGEINPFDRLEIIKRRMNRGEAAPFVKLTQDLFVPFIEVDINFSLDWLPANEGLTELFLQNTLKSHAGLRTLDAEHCFIYLCMHLYKEAAVLSMVKRLKDIELYKYVDIFRIVKLIKIEVFWELADWYGLRSQCEYVLYCTNLLFPSLDLKISKPKGLDKVIDPENGDKEYVWKLPFIERMNDTSRLNKLRSIDEK